MESAEVTKLYEPFPTLCLYVAPAACMVGRVPLIPLFFAGNSNCTIHHKYSQPEHKRSGFPVTLQQRMAGVAARRSGSLRRLLIRSRGTCAARELRLTGVARLIGPDAM